MNSICQYFLRYSVYTLFEAQSVAKYSTVVKWPVFQPFARQTHQTQGGDECVFHETEGYSRSDVVTILVNEWMLIHWISAESSGSKKGEF